ncbi:MAG: hypothetical protein H7A32_05495 [Deltaproteobacteria bacterium]|nr:hypothetical protein [Deltaproteobacteria bacterium]
MKYKKLFFILISILAFNFSSKVDACEEGLFLRPFRVGIQHDIIWDPTNISGPDINILGPENILSTDGQEFVLEVQGSDADNDTLFYYWYREGSCEFSVDPCDTNSQYTQVKVKVFGGKDSSCIVYASGNDYRGRQDIARVSFKQDNDGDGLPNPDDAFPDDPNEWNDQDNDGIGDNADPDDDNDGIPDDQDKCNILNENMLDVNKDGCQDQLVDLLNYLESLNLPKGIENSLRVKLENAFKKCQQGNLEPTKNALKAFINEVNALKGKKITEEQAKILLQYAQGFLDALNENNPDKNNNDVLDICESPFPEQIKQDNPDDKNLNNNQENQENISPGGCSLRVD